MRIPLSSCDPALDRAGTWRTPAPWREAPPPFERIDTHHLPHHCPLVPGVRHTPITVRHCIRCGVMAELRCCSSAPSRIERQVVHRRSGKGRASGSHVQCADPGALFRRRRTPRDVVIRTTRPATTGRSSAHAPGADVRTGTRKQWCRPAIDPWPESERCDGLAPSVARSVDR